MNVMARFSFYVCINTMLFPHGFSRYIYIIQYLWELGGNGFLELIKFFLDVVDLLRKPFLSNNTENTLALVKFWALLRVVWLERAQAQESSDMGHLKLCQDKFGTT